MSNWTRFIAGFDVHGDKQNKVACEVFFRFMKDWKPEIRVMGGDLFDFRPLRRKASEEEKRESMREDFEAGMGFLKRMRPTHYLRGNHSFVADADILTLDGWKKVNSLSVDDLVAQFDDAGNISYANPTALHINTEYEYLVAIEGHGTKQIVTDRHDVIVDGKKVKAFELLGKRIDSRSIRTSGRAYHGHIRSESDDMLTLLTWVLMDGTIVDFAKYKAGSKKIRVQFRLSLQPKIAKLKALLDKMSVPYTFAESKKAGANKLQPYVIRIYGDWARKINAALPGKRMPAWFAKLDRRELDVFLEALKDTDGHAREHQIHWATVDFKSADLIQEACALNGYECIIRHRSPRPGQFANAKIQALVTIQLKPRANFSKLKIERLEKAGACYCVTMPLGTVVSRLDGKVAFTGNCERLWDLAAADKGVESDYAYQGVNDIVTTCERMKCKLYPYHKREGIIRIGSHLKILHGFASGVYAARQTALVYGSVLFGHIHVVDEHSIPGLERRAARCCGCLCELDMDYAARTPSTLRQANGFAYGVVNKKTGLYHVWTAESINGLWMIPSDIAEYE